MNQIRNYPLALLILVLPAAAQASPDWVYATHANISIPEGSPLIHMPSLEDETLHEFVGQVELAGKVQVGWYRWIAEDSIEIEMELMFVPAAEQHTKLPVVQHPLEPPTLPSLISLDIPNGDESAMLTRLFGEKLAADILKRPDHGRIAVGGRADLVLFSARRWSEFLSRPQADRIVMRNGMGIDRSLPDYRELDPLLGV